MQKTTFIEMADQRSESLFNARGDETFPELMHAFLVDFVNNNELTPHQRKIVTGAIKKTNRAKAMIGVPEPKESDYTLSKDYEAARLKWTQTVQKGWAELELAIGSLYY